MAATSSLGKRTGDEVSMEISYLLFYYIYCRIVQVQGMYDKLLKVS